MSDDLRRAGRDVVRSAGRLLFGLVVVVGSLAACIGLGALIAGGGGAFIGLLVGAVALVTLKVLATWTNLGGPVACWDRHFEQM